MNKTGFEIPTALLIAVFSGVVFLLGFLIGTIKIGQSSQVTNGSFVDTAQDRLRITSLPTHCANEKLYDNLDDALIEVGKFAN